MHTLRHLNESPVSAPYPGPNRHARCALLCSDGITGNLSTITLSNDTTRGRPSEVRTRPEKRAKLLSSQALERLP